MRRGACNEFPFAGNNANSGTSVTPVHAEPPDAVLPFSDRAASLTEREQSALAFIAVENAHRRYPNGGDVRRYLNLPWVRQSARVIESLIRSGHVIRTDRGLEVCVR